MGPFTEWSDDRADAERLRDEVSMLLYSVATWKEKAERLKAAIERHRDQKGDDRCWLDDAMLYASLQDGIAAETALPPRCEFLESCGRYWDQRQNPLDRDKAATDEMTIAQLQARVKELESKVERYEIRDQWETFP